MIKILPLLFLNIFLFGANLDIGAAAPNFELRDQDGVIHKLNDYKGKAVLLVNVASNCGFTKQYNDLQLLWDKYRSKGLVVIGIPSNQFGSQEPGSNKEIKDFCEVNFNITFPMSSKTDVKGNNAHPIYLWAQKNYGKSAVPKWNFHKILINKDGKVQKTYSSFTKPMSNKIIDEIKKNL